MPRLIDDIIAGKARIWDDGSSFRLPPGALEFFLRATAIFVDPVINFYFSSPKFDAEVAIFKPEVDFPNVAPPFEVFWLEGSLPPTVLVQGKQEDVRTSWIKRWGALFAGNKRNDGWWLEMHPFVHKRDGDIVKWGGSITLPVNADGSPGPLTAWKTAVPASCSPKDQGQISDIASTLCAPLLLAISFMHCKNVALKLADPAPPKLARRYEERHGVPLVRGYVLDIEPMRKVLRTEGQSDIVGVKKALHICRGHFKNYREGGGLFGKHKGLYWWEPAVRGTSEAGVVEKDYRVKI